MDPACEGFGGAPVNRQVLASRLLSVAKPALQTFGKYQILERVATGGMAEIYKARLEGIGGFQRTFAIKRILPHLSSNAEYVAMLVDEAKVAGLLSHANIVQILDLGQVENVWYIAMEFVDGPDLGAVLRRCRQKGIELPVPHTVFVALELLKGLEYAHQRQVMRGGRTVPLNIIHRDVSPPNILLSMQGEVKLTDFGIARASHKALETVAGVVKGRFDYMSPEQASGSRDLDQRSDLFSVGVVLYEMLTGVHPFRAESELATIERVREGRYEPASLVNPGVPFTLETIVDRALRVDRNERYPSATAFKEALDRFFHDAGFLFTHHSLSTYVRGLFPELTEGSEPRPPDPTSSVAPLASFDDDDDGEGDGPTRVVGQQSLSRPPVEGPGFGVKSDETSTLVRRATPGREWEEEQQETVVRKASSVAEPPAPPVEPDTLLRKRGPQDPSAPEISLDPPSQGSGTRRVAPAPPGAPVGANPAWLWVAAGSVGVLGLLVGVFVGTVAGAVAGTMLAPQAQGSTPVLQVEAPAGAIVTVDGALVQGAIQVAPGEIHAVAVQLPGRSAPLRATVTLRSGEVRLLVISEVQVP
jgi:serine/threonine protein kinase